MSVLHLSSHSVEWDSTEHSANHSKTEAEGDFQKQLDDTKRAARRDRRQYQEERCRRRIAAENDARMEKRRIYSEFLNKVSLDRAEAEREHRMERYEKYLREKNRKTLVFLLTSYYNN